MISDQDPITRLMVVIVARVRSMVEGVVSIDDLHLTFLIVSKITRSRLRLRLRTNLDILRTL